MTETHFAIARENGIGPSHDNLVLVSNVLHTHFFSHIVDVIVRDVVMRHGGLEKVEPLL